MLALTHAAVKGQGEVSGTALWPIARGPPMAEAVRFLCQDIRQCNRAHALDTFEVSATPFRIDNDASRARSRIARLLNAPVASLAAQAPLQILTALIADVCLSGYTERKDLRLPRTAPTCPSRTQSCTSDFRQSTTTRIRSS